MGKFHGQCTEQQPRVRSWEFLEYMSNCYLLRTLHFMVSLLFSCLEFYLLKVMDVK